LGAKSGVDFVDARKLILLLDFRAKDAFLPLSNPITRLLFPREGDANKKA
jgi:hypothetical protein